MVRTTDLVSLEQLAAADLSGTLAKHINAPANAAAIESIIAGVTRSVEDYLGRTLIVCVKTTAEVEAHNWMQSGSGWCLWAPAWPVVQVVTNGVTALPSRPGGQLLYADARLTTIEFYAGYRRSDQDLAALDVDGLTTLPGVIPEAIADVAISLALSRLRYRLDGLAGMREIQTDNGGFRTVQRAEPGYERDVLSWIAGYRVL